MSMFLPWISQREREVTCSRAYRMPVAGQEMKQGLPASSPVILPLEHPYFPVSEEIRYRTIVAAASTAVDANRKIAQAT